MAIFRIPAVRPLVRVLAGALAIGLLVQAPGASAIDLMQAYQAALQNDPTYRVALRDYDAGKENTAIGRSGLLPSISANVSRSKNRTDLDDTDFLGKPRHTQPAYTSGSKTVSLRQPIFNMDAVARYKLGIAQTKFSEAQLKARSQDLVMRLVTAYVEVLFADDQVALAQAQRDMYVEQKKVNDRLFKQGEGTRTDVLETQAKLDLAETALIEALDSQTDSRNTLTGIIGIDAGVLKPLGPEFDTVVLAEGTFEKWKGLALDSNAEIIGQTYAIEAARQEVKRNRAGHFPRLDFVASYGKSDSETLNTRGQSSLSRSIGFQLNIPLYAGGYVNATTRQAVANEEKAEADLAARINKVLVELEKQYNMMVSAKTRMNALVRASESGKLLIEATRQSIKGGIRINLDLLNAQQQQYSTMRDHAKARYNYLLTYLRLRLAAGTLSGDDVEAAARYFR